MTPYIFILLSSILLYYSSFYLKKNDNQEGYILVAFLLLSSLILFSGLRDYSIGTDTRNYVFMFNRLELLDMGNVGIFKESGFVIIQWIAKLINNDYHIVMILIASIIIIVTLKCIGNYSDHPVFTFFLYIALGFYTSHFNIARQSIAVAIFLYSIKYIFERNLAKYLIFIAAGFLFHKSIVLCLPCYWFANKMLNLRSMFIVFIVVLGCSFVLDAFVEFTSINIDHRYQGFAEERDSSGGVVQNLFYVFVLFYIYFMKVIFKIVDAYYNIFLNISFIGVSIGVASVVLKLDPNGIARASIYFVQTFIFTLPYAIYKTRNVIFRTTSFVSVILLSFIYYYLIIYSFADLYPFRFL